jgi:anaerobic magnesium-protoporphyrin IX monomethyl ester cyclase
MNIIDLDIKDIGIKGKKLNILLVMPRLVQTIGDGYAFPLGIAYVSSSLKAAGFNVFTLNLNHIEGDVFDILKQTIIKNNINVVGTGGLSFQYPTIRDIVEYTKAINNKLITIVGGGIITAEPEIALQALEDVDFGVIGEGEITICELAHGLENNENLSNICGLVFKQGDHYHCTNPRQEIMNLDALPRPDYDGFGLETYLELPASSVHNRIASRMAYICGSRSCPYSCTFCFHTTGKKYRQRSIEDVLEEILFLQKHYHISSVCMTDELFAREKDRIKKFNEIMNQFDISWYASFRADDVNQELIDILKGGKCASMSFGLESAENRVLKSMRKHITIEQIENALKMVYDAGIPVAGNFIFGDVKETYETARTTLDWWINHAEYSMGLNLITTYPGSYIYQYACKNNIITDRVKFLKDGCPQVNISQMNKHELGMIVKEIFEAPYKYGNQVKDIQAYQVKPGGRITISGKCCGCKAENTWENIKLFAGNSWLPCTKCGQKHYVPLLPKLQENLFSNILNMLKDYKNIAMWGVTYYSITLFNNSSIFKDPGITFIDNASSKQMMNINGKKVYDPSILGDKEIPAVVIFYPSSILQLSSQIQKLYPNVKKIFDVCDMI